MRRSIVACVLTTLVGAAACTDSEGDTLVDELDIDLASREQRAGGLYSDDVEVGTGAEAVAGQLVVVHYSGWLADGTPFDSSRDGGVPFETIIGEGSVIQGWDQGIPGMREGGRRKLVIPPDLAYGAAGAGGVIPPNATLVFDVELLEVRDPGMLMPDESIIPDTGSMPDTLGATR
ncbi:FKBP-type peptidyl-prolyl cis-trans isomerase [soil metagenome]